MTYLDHVSSVLILDLDYETILKKCIIVQCPGTVHSEVSSSPFVCLVWPVRPPLCHALACC